MAGDENATEYFEVESTKRRKGKSDTAVILIILVSFLALVLIIGLIVGLQSSQEPFKGEPLYVVEGNKRIDCYPEASSPQENVDHNKCEARGCIWSPSDSVPGAPACYWPPDGPNNGLQVLAQEDLPDGKRWKLHIKEGSRPFNSKITHLTLTVQELSNDIVRFKFEDADDPARYQVPITTTHPTGPKDRLQYTHTVRDDPFSLRIARSSNNVTIWDTAVGGLIFTDQFLQIATLLPSKNVYGFGENVHQSFRHDVNFTLWPMFARDEFPEENGRNFYGFHPFYECVEEDGNAHGVFLLNSNAMEYGFTPAPMLTYRTIGGILDFYVFLGPSPENVIQQYTSLIGRPYMPPYWALGFQLCRYGYKNTSDIKAAVDRTLHYEIPLDVQYADIDYMDHQRDFTLDQENFAELPEYFREIQGLGIRTIIILDPCIEINDTYEPYLRGKEADIFIKWPSRDIMPTGDFEEHHNTDIMGYVWPEWKVVFPDFFHPGVENFWTDLVVDFRKTISFDGIWIDMNEPANFGTNEDKAWNWDHGPPFWTLKCPVSKWDNPPYRPKAAYIYDTEERKARLSDKTVCMVGDQADGVFKHYDVHNLYGHSQSLVSLRSMRKALGSKRGQLITRSSYPGTGAVAGHWLGDNRSTWSHLRLSIIGLLEFNLFGIPYIGADICGFFGNTSPELCMRWMQLGAFYPFARNHNHKDSEHQDPGYLGPVVAAASREAFHVRYSLLPYLYTLFHKAHIHGDTVVRPLFHEFPRDKVALGIDRQFLWGPALLVSPILEEKQRVLKLYFPDGIWYDFYGGRVASKASNNSGYLDILVSNTSGTQLHLRGGYIIPKQGSANNTFYSRQNPFGLIVALDGMDGSAQGELFWDDGESIDTYETGNFLSASFTCSNNTLKMEIQHNGLAPDITSNHFQYVIIVGVSEVNEVHVNDGPFLEFFYDNSLKLLDIDYLQLEMTKPFTIRWN